MGDPSANIVICYQPSGITAIQSLPFRIMGGEKEKPFFSQEKFRLFNQDTETSLLSKKFLELSFTVNAGSKRRLRGKIIPIFGHVSGMN